MQPTFSKVMKPKWLFITWVLVSAKHWATKSSKISHCYCPAKKNRIKSPHIWIQNVPILTSCFLKFAPALRNTKKLKQAVITQAVTKGVRGEREMKDSGVEWIGEIPKEWVCEKIKYATSISRGLFNHRPRNDERYYNGKYPFIQTGDVANATKYIVSYSQTLNELGKSVSKEFPKGTLTMTIAANVGDVAILNFDAYFPDSVVGFVPNKNIRTLYLFYVFSAMKDEFIRTAIKSTQLNLNIDRVKETFIPVTLNVNEQCEIENYLESKCAEIDGLIAKKEQLVKELESYKKSLIYEVVTGKREV
ncbi:MAG: restriction endonuclease subunit S [Subdoligranulum sp.]